MSFTHVVSNGQSDDDDDDDDDEKAGIDTEVQFNNTSSINQTAWDETSANSWGTPTRLL